ncbi:hypothetical protein ES703_35478 [subsurface metagenome]
MSNSFNISVKPEIAAVSAKVDANKVVIDENKVILVDVHDTDLPAVKTDTSDIRTNVTVIHDTDLPAAKTVIDENKVILADIHDTDLPAAKTEIDSIVTAMAQFNPAMIPNVGYDSITVPSDAWVDPIDITGAGYLHFFQAECSGVNFVQIKISIDGTLINLNMDGTPLTWTANNTLPLCRSFAMAATVQGRARFPPATIETNSLGAHSYYLSIRFETRLLIQLQMDGDESACPYQYIYSLT